jgi:hypothetical protein
MRIILICHDEEPMTRHGLARWLNSFSELAGIVVLRETRKRKNKRIRFEIKRVGLLRFLDVVAFRIYYRLFLAGKDRTWEKEKLGELFDIYPDIDPEIPILYAKSPNSKSARLFIEEARPDIVIARCKVILAKRIFSIPSIGTFVMHPGICPEYRNAHGCFWALASDDLERVGMTLLKIDEGVDTGPVYGHYTYDYDEVGESHAVIQHRVVVDNLDALKEKLVEIYEGRAAAIDTHGRESASWGQPWLTKHLRWKYRARRRAK